MNLDEAKAAVLERLLRRGVGEDEGGIAFVESQTIERPYGWILFYNSRRYLESGEIEYALVGQGPVVVIAETGEVIELGSAYPTEIAIKELEDRLRLAGRSSEA